MQNSIDRDFLELVNLSDYIEIRKLHNSTVELLNSVRLAATITKKDNRGLGTDVIYQWVVRVLTANT